MKQWYVLHVLTGKERDVVNRLAGLGLDAAAPEQMKLIRHSGSWHEEASVLIPGYVFVLLDYTAEAYHLMTSISGVVYLLPKGEVPVPLLPEECNWLLIACAEALHLSRVDFSNGTPRVMDGPLLQWEEYIIQLDRHRRRALLNIPLFGQMHKIQLSILPIL